MTRIPTEDDILPTRPVVIVIVVTVVFAGLLVLWASLSDRAREARLRPNRAFPERQLGAPHKVAGVREHMFDSWNESARRNQHADAQLDAYRWVDRERGLVAIPIDRAIELLVRGAP